MKFRTSFDQCDPAGILFFAQVFTIAHRALEDFVWHSEIGWRSWFAHPDYVVPIRHTEADFYSPITANETIDVNLSAKKLTRSSVAFEVLLKRGSQECAKVILVSVFVSRSSRSTMAIPEAIRSVLIAVFPQVERQ